MPKKFRGENSKVAAAKERKAVHKAEVEKQKTLEQERLESEKWSKGAKKAGRKEEQDVKRMEKLTKKKEKEDLLKEEEKELSKLGKPKQPPKVRGVEKKAVKKQIQIESLGKSTEPVESFAARNIEDAIDLLSSVAGSAGGGPTPAGAKSGAALSTTVAIDRHPERRAKAAYKAFEDRRLMELKDENPGLRLSQLKQMIFKEWQKAPENPFNQARVAHNATQEEIEQVLAEQRQKLQERLRIDA